jgi:hypothetical protein
MPLSGTINNSGTIEIDSTSGQSELELIEHGITLQGGGQVTLSDSTQNILCGTAPDVTLTNVDNTISGAGQLGAGQMTLVNEGTIAATGANALLIDTGPNLVFNSGTLEATGSGGLMVMGAVENTGTLWADGGKVTVDGAVTGNGNALISGSGVLEFGGASSANTTFAADSSGTLKLDDVLDFTGTIRGFNEHDRLDIGDIQYNGNISIQYSANAAGTGGTLTISDGTHTANVTLAGEYDASGFQVSGDGGAGSLITYVSPTNPVLDPLNLTHQAIIT